MRFQAITFWHLYLPILLCAKKWQCTCPTIDQLKANICLPTVFTHATSKLLTAYQFQMCHIWLLIYPKTNHHLWNSISSPIPTTWYKWTFIINKLVEIHGVAFNEVRGLLITCRFNLQDWFICSSLHSSESKKGVVLIQEKKERNAHTWEKDIP